MESKKSTDKWFPIILTDDSDFKTPKLSIATGAIIVNYSYEGASSLSGYYPGASQWTEAGSGVYWLQMGADEFVNEGKYQVDVHATGSLNYNFPVEIRDHTLAELIDFVNTVSGNLDTVDTVVDSVLVDTGTTLDTKIDNTINYLTTVSGNIDNIDTELNLVSVSGYAQTALDSMSGQMAGALTQYDPPTRAELTTDKTSITTAITQLSGVVQTENDNTQSYLNTVSGLITTMKTYTDRLPDSTIDGKTHEEVLEILLAYSQGKIERTNDTYVYKKQDNTTTLFTLTSASATRTRS